MLVNIKLLYQDARCNNKKTVLAFPLGVIQGTKTNPSTLGNQFKLLASQGLLHELR
jgi:hypothetical protein